MTYEYTNFKSNLKARAPELLEVLDIDYLFKITKNRFKRTIGLFNEITEEQRNIMVNNALIFAFTDDIISAYKEFNRLPDDVTDRIIGNIIQNEENLAESLKQ